MASNNESPQHSGDEDSIENLSPVKKIRSEKNKNAPIKWIFSGPLPHPFRLGDYGEGSQPRCLMELNMMKMSASIRSKKDWLQKKDDPVIVSKWKTEASQQGLTEAQIDYVIKELEYYAALRDGTIEPSTVDGVWQSDGLIPETLKESLIQQVANLENVPEWEKDWHPGSNKQVLDLVHPSLYCLVYGVTRRTKDPAIPPLDFIGTGEVIPGSGDRAIKDVYGYVVRDYAVSTKYQWLPTDFDVSDTGDVDIKSYINNLHPVWHKDMYTTLAAIFKECIPLLNKVLTDLKNPRPLRIEVNPFDWYTEAPERDSEQSEEDDDDYDEFRGRDLIFPEPQPFQMPDLMREISVDLRGRPLQVIVKLANIILTPENPKYPGGSWHVEGMENEHIVASAIYYYASENISESKLLFREAVCEPNYEQNDTRGVREIYGLVDEGPLNQDLGAVLTQQDRCIAFPNTLQHRVAPFELVDKTKPGYRKILVFFLVDPATRVISTTHVPPQQKSWLLPQLRSAEQFNKLPEEILEKIFEELPWPMSLEEAKAHREKLMEERKYFISVNNESLFERPFSLCEH